MFIESQNRTLLPIYPTSFVGRGRELSELTHLLRQSDLHLLTLTGIGGIGKTRLALHLASHLASSFPSGVLLVPLVSILDPAQLLPVIAQSLGLRETSSDDLASRLYAHLQEKQLLLLLDNFEQLLPAAPQLSALIQNCPMLKLLITSRAVLHIQGEHEYLLSPLSLPLSSHLSKEQLAHTASISLFIQRARAVKPGFQLTSANAQTIAFICQRLDGLPLALELAAARCKLLSPQALLERLDQRLVLLTSTAQDVPPHQRTLRSTLAWSYDLLTPQEQQLFRRLSIFVGGFTLSAAGTLCSVPPILSLEILDGLSSLLDKSLLSVVETDESEPRFLMLETIREFGLSCLETEHSTIASAHSAYYLSLAQKAAPYLTGPQQRFWLKTLAYEQDNLLAALTSLLDTQQWTQALALAGSLWHFWWMRGQIFEGERYLQKALALSHDVPDLDPLILARALNAAGTLAGLRGDMTHAESLCRESLSLLGTQNNPTERIKSLWMLGYVARERSLYSEAQTFVTEALTLARQIQDSSAITYALEALSAIALELGEYDQSEILIKECLTLARQIDDTWEIARSLWLYALARLSNGDHVQAHTLLDESLALSHEVEDIRGIAYALVMLAYVALFEGQPARMQQLIEESLLWHREAGDRRGTAEALLGLGWAHLLQHKSALAQTAFEESLTLLHVLGRTWFLTLALEGLSISLISSNQWERALYLWGAAQALRSARSIALSPYVAALYQSFLDQAQAHLSPETFSTFISQGHALVHNGELLPALFNPPTLVSVVASNHPKSTASSSSSAFAGLTPREIEVLRWVTQGFTDNQIAEKLVISPRTVSTHLTSIYNKLNISTRSAATRIALEQHLL